MDTALLAGILAAPEDDAPRLILADWLDENGEPERALAIRTMCHVDVREHAVATVSGKPVYCNFSNPMQSFRLCPPLWAERTEFRRGFVSAVTCSAADFLRHADTLVWHPASGRPCPSGAQPVEAVTLTSRPDLMRDSTSYYFRGDESLVPIPANAVDEYSRPREGEPAELLCLRYRFPSVRTWTLPESASYAANREAIEQIVPPARDMDLADAFMSAAPPDNARRRPGHSRMPGWLAGQRERPHRR